jgi:small neutral amino acid transporter SnatA (MarC family)
MNNRQRIVPFWVPLIFGIMALTSVLTRPSFQTVRAVDAVTLVAAGMCFGSALTRLVLSLRDRKAA